MLLQKDMAYRVGTVSVQRTHKHSPYTASHASSGANPHHFAPPRHIDRSSLLILQAIGTPRYTSPASVFTILPNTPAQPGPTFGAPPISMDTAFARFQEMLNDTICREVRIRDACVRTFVACGKTGDGACSGLPVDYVA
jgi:hypothetical protein